MQAVRKIMAREIAAEIRRSYSAIRDALPDAAPLTVLQISSEQTAIAEKQIGAASPIDNAALVKGGVLRRAKDGLRLLGEGELKSKVSITVNHASAAAKAAVEKAGGTVTVIAKKVLAADEAKRKKTAAKRAKSAPKKSAASEE